MVGAGGGGDCGGEDSPYPSPANSSPPLTLSFLDFMYIGIELTEASLQVVSVL